MATQHVLTCPVCHAALLIEHSDQVGGQVISNLVLLDAAAETPEAAAARATYDAAQDATIAAQDALAKAQADLDDAVKETPPDDTKILAASAAVSKAQGDLDAAKLAEADAQANYEKIRNTPPPPPIGTLSPDGRWEWGGTEWILRPLEPPPLPAGVTPQPETAAEEVAEEKAESPAEVVANG